MIDDENKGQNKSEQGGGTELSIRLVNNIITHNDYDEIICFLNISKLSDIWIFEESLKEAMTLKRLLMVLCDYRVFMFNSEVIDGQLTSFQSSENNKNILITTNIKLDINHCNLLEYVDAMQLLFNPEITELAFSTNEGEINNCHIMIEMIQK